MTAKPAPSLPPWSSLYASTGVLGTSYSAALAEDDDAARFLLPERELRELAGEVCKILTVSIIRSNREFSPCVFVRFVDGSSSNLKGTVEKLMPFECIFAYRLLTLLLLRGRVLSETSL